MLSGTELMSVLSGAELMSVLSGTELMSVLSGAELMSVLSGTELMSVLSGTELMSVLSGTELMSVLSGTELMSVLSGTELMSVLSGAELMSWCGCICTHDAKSGVDRAMQTNREALKTMSRQVIPTSSRNCQSGETKCLYAHKVDDNEEWPVVHQCVYPHVAHHTNSIPHRSSVVGTRAIFLEDRLVCRPHKK